jgi:IS605 OrfB family transposase
MALIIQKIKVPEVHWPRLGELQGLSVPCVERMLRNRGETSSKFYPEIPCVLSKSLVKKYQRNPECKKVTRVVLPICGDKGKQIKIEKCGFRVPAFFKKAVIPVTWIHPIAGHIRNVEFIRKGGEWFAHICYSITCAKPIKPQGCIGIDRNSVGNIAVLCDPQNGKVKILGVSASPFKYNFRRRKAELMSQGRRRLVSKMRRKQERRTTYENHRTSKAIVDYAQAHCRAIAIEDLGGVYAKDSKIKGYSQRSQWAVAQQETFVRYKACIAGVPIIEVNPAYTSQECSRCGERHKFTGKVFLCPSCGSKQHRDANSGFVIAGRGNKILNDVGSGVENGAPLGPESPPLRDDLLGGPLSGNGGHSNE